MFKKAMTKKGSVSKKVVIVTGASGGIGKAIAQILVKNGAKVVVASRSKTQIAKTLFVPTDVRDPLAVRNLITTTWKKFGRIDVLINCAGILKTGPFEKTPTEEIKEMLDTNLLGTFICCKYVLPVMKQQKSGHILNISSVLGTKAKAFYAMYCATKFGVMGLSEALQQEVKEFGIFVSTLRPGTVATDLFGKNSQKELSKRNDALTPDDVAQAVLFLLEQPSKAGIRDLAIVPKM